MSGCSHDVVVEHPEGFICVACDTIGEFMPKDLIVFGMTVAASERKLRAHSQLLNKVAHAIAVTLKRVGPDEDLTFETPEKLDAFVWECVVSLIESQRQWRANAREIAKEAFGASKIYGDALTFDEWWQIQGHN